MDATFELSVQELVNQTMTREQSQAHKLFGNHYDFEMRLASGRDTMAMAFIFDLYVAGPQRRAKFAFDTGVNRHGFLQ